MDPHSKEIARTLLSNGYQCYFVGGAVRDALLGRVSHDIDLATDALPYTVASLFSRTSSVGQGLKHGTVVVAMGSQNYEVTTFRSDVSSDGRHSEVAFAKDITTDLSRRDFSINAIAMGLDGSIVDPFNGRGDILDKVLRTVGPAKDRLNEDRLRMLRAVRFSANLGFQMDPTLLDEITRGSDRITTISIERCKDELVKMLSGDNVMKALCDLRDTGLLGQFMPEIAPCFGFPQNKFHTLDVFNHMATACAALPKEKPILRLAALVHDISKPETCQGRGTPDASFHGHEIVGAKKVQKLMQRMTFSSAETERVSNLVRHHMFRYGPELSDSAVRRLVTSVGLDNVNDLIELKWADRVGKGSGHYSKFNPSTKLRLHVDRLVKEASAFKMSDVKLNGNDLKVELGLPEGPKIGKTLRYLFDQVQEDSSLNTREALLELAKRFRSSEDTA